MKLKEYALYAGEDILAMGTMKEIAEALGLSYQTVKYYNSAAYAERIRKREMRTKGRIGDRVLICLEDDYEQNR